jgi:hypothetical protein
VSGVELNRKALEQLQESVNGRATDLLKLKDGRPGGKDDGDFGGAFPAARDAKAFGALADSEALATAVEGIEKKASGELTDAKKRLEGVERALEDVLRNIRKADDGSTVRDPQ